MTSEGQSSVLTKIRNPVFQSAGRNNYKASSVEAYVKFVINEYTKLYDIAERLRNSYEEISKRIEEYEKQSAVVEMQKKDIADVLLEAKIQARHILEKANEEAEQIVSQAEQKVNAEVEQKISQSQEYYKSTINEAEEKLQMAQAELSRVQQQAVMAADEYSRMINEHAESIINDAIEKAAKITADAASDVEKIKAKSDQIVLQANNQLNDIKKKYSDFRSNIRTLLDEITPAINSGALIDNFTVKNLISESEEKSDAIVFNPDDIERPEKFNFNPYKENESTEGISDISADEKITQNDFEQSFESNNEGGVLNKEHSDSIKETLKDLNQIESMLLDSETEDFSDNDFSFISGQSSFTKPQEDNNK